MKISPEMREAINSKPLPGLDVLRRYLAYDPDTGRFLWRPRDLEMFSGEKPRWAWMVWNKRFAGRPALIFINDHGYLQGRIDGVLFRAHRVAWKMAHGYDPDVIDHINGNRRDNRIANLRSVNQQENSRNASVRADSTSGVSGVSRCGDGWRAYLFVEGTQHHIGVFPTKEAALRARRSAQDAAGYHKNHGRVAVEH